MRALPLLLLLTGCTTIGPGVLQRSRVRFNEAVKATSEQEMLLNIVRLRYTDTPSSLAISNIAAQYELSAGLGAMPFFAAGADRGLNSVLPQATLGGADRPTISFTPLDDSEFARRLFTPLSLEGIIYLAKTTWPIQTVFRLYLENLNWVPNAQTASGPTPALAPPESRFLEGMKALQVLQQRGDLVFGPEDHPEPLGPPVAQVSSSDVLTATQQGLTFVARPGGTWQLERSARRFVLHLNPAVLDSAELLLVREVFHLKPGRDHYDVTIESAEPFSPPKDGAESIDLETRSLLQALFFVSHGVEVPSEHFAHSLARQTRTADGQPFDWHPTMDGLFTVKSARGGCGREEASVAVDYAGYCFFIDPTDHDTRATFSLLMELSRLELSGSATRAGPMLTIPIGR